MAHRQEVSSAHVMDVVRVEDDQQLRATADDFLDFRLGIFGLTVKLNRNKTLRQSFMISQSQPQVV